MSGLRTWRSRREIARTGLLICALALTATSLFAQTKFVPPDPPKGYTPVSIGQCTDGQQALTANLGTTSISGAVDPHWIVTGPTGTLSPGHTALPSQWNALPTSWVQPYPPSATAFQNAPGGTKPSRSTYTIWFDLPCPPDSYKGLQLTGSFAADNTGQVYVNSTPYQICTGCFSSSTGAINFSAFSGFVQGTNSLSVVVDNTDDNSPTGVSVNATLNGTCTGVCKASTLGILKVCKVAGTGITVGTPFNFTISTSTSHAVLTVPAGPAPGGTCMIGPSYAVGTQVSVTEAPVAGTTVSSISVAPPGQLVSTNLAGGNVTVAIGNGVTEVTYTDQRTGFLEICKKGDVSGSFNFVVDPGGLGPFAVPAGACSPAIEVAAGSVTIHELTSGVDIVACSTIPPAAQQAICNNTPPGSQNSVVTVMPGDISTMTIAFITNRQKGAPAQ